MRADRIGTHKKFRLLTVVVLTFLTVAGLSALADSAKRTRPSVSGGSSGSSRPSASTAAPSRPGGGSSGSVTRVFGRAGYGYHHRGYTYYPGGSYYGGYGGYGWPYDYGWYGSYGYGWWPYGYGWYGPYAGPRHRMVTVAISPNRNAPAVLEADVVPKKAHLVLNGDDLGKVKYFNGNWDRLPLAPGVHKLAFMAKGYRTLRVEMEVESGRFYRLDYRMEKGEGEDPRSMRLPRSSESPAVAKSPEGDTEFKVAAAPGLHRGLLRLRVSPGDAAIYLDGEFLGRGEELARLHGALPVAAGVHRLEVVRPGYRSKSLEIDVQEEGDPLQVTLDLDRE